jgi:hypothetical protein
MKPFSAITRHRRLIASIDGMPFTGKTHFMLTMPPPAVVFSIDAGLEGVVEDMEGEGWDFSDFEVEDYSDKPPLTSAKMHLYAKDTIARFRQSWREVLNRKTRTSIGIDTGSEFWQLFRLADLGKLEQVPPMRYTKVNRLWRAMLNEIANTPHNFVIIHREKDRYDSRIIDSDDGPKEVSVRVPNETVRDGFKEIDGIVQVVIQSTRRERRNGSVEMGFTVRKCRQRARLMGQTYRGPLATFATLALDVFPASEPEEWGL